MLWGCTLESFLVVLVLCEVIIKEIKEDSEEKDLSVCGFSLLTIRREVKKLNLLIAQSVLLFLRVKIIPR